MSSLRERIREILAMLWLDARISYTSYDESKEDGKYRVDQATSAIMDEVEKLIEGAKLEDRRNRIYNAGKKAQLEAIRKLFKEKK